MDFYKKDIGKNTAISDQGDISAMKELFLLIGAVLAFAGLLSLQTRVLKKHHPNAELLIGLFKMLNSENKRPKEHSNG
jgi:hypothetical protein